MRPEPGPTRASDDFPVALGPDNVDGMWGIRDETGWIAGLAALTRPFATSAGTLPVAGIGSVVTRPDRRGRGLSTRLQEFVVAELAGRGVPLAVLWTDRPEIYAGRGFAAAGWEYHVALDALPLHELWPEAGELWPLGAAEAAAIADLYAGHPLRTLREPEDHALLYGMPGTRILGLAVGGRLLAHACCGKGVDFPDYVAEWSGQPSAALALLARVHADGLASRALVPAGREDLLDAAVALGAGVAVIPSGFWAVTEPEQLRAAAGPVAPGRERDPAAWLGRVHEDGTIEPGRLRVAVWGLDSV